MLLEIGKDVIISKMLQPNKKIPEYIDKPLSAKEILSELAQAREAYKNAEGEEIDSAVDDIRAKYGLEE